MGCCRICGVQKQGNKKFFAKFPSDENRCREWVKIVGEEDLVHLPIEKLCTVRFICGDHFEKRDFNKKGNRLKKRALPKLKLTRPPLSDEVLHEFPLHTAETEPRIVKIKHMSTVPIAPMDDPPDTSIMDEDMDSTDINALTEDNDLNNVMEELLNEKEEMINEINIQFLDPNSHKEIIEIKSEPEDNPATQQSEDNLTEAEYWNLKLKHILHSTHFCGICLKADVNANSLSDVFEIVVNQRTRTHTLIDIVQAVFNETENLLSNSIICNCCVKNLIQSYTFIQNARDKAKILNYHLNEMYDKTCYIRNNVIENSDVRNVVISLAHNNYFDNEKQTEEIETNKIEETQIMKFSTDNYKTNTRIKIHTKAKEFKCFKCDIILPSFNAMVLHETSTHNTILKCSICGLTVKTLELLKLHHKEEHSKWKSPHGVKHKSQVHTQHRSKRVFICDVCQQQFCSKKEMIVHITNYRH